MKIGKFTDVPAKAFDTDTTKGVEARVLIGKQDGAKNFCMRLFVLDKGGFTPRHSHPWEHEIFVHQGQGQAFREGTWVDMESGSFVFVPGNQEHQFRNAGDSPLVLVCVIPSGPPEL